MNYLELAAVCYIGAAVCLVLRTLLDIYVERYKKRHHQWPYNERTAK